MARFLRKVERSGALTIALLWLALELPVITWAVVFVSVGSVIGFITTVHFGWIFSAIAVVIFCLPSVVVWISHIIHR